MEPSEELDDEPSPGARGCARDVGILVVWVCAALFAAWLVLALTFPSE